MAKVQIITAMTLDGFLPGEDEELFKWVKTDKRGFPFWHGKSTFMLSIGYPMLDLICERMKRTLPVSIQRKSRTRKVLNCCIAFPSIISLTKL